MLSQDDLSAVHTDSTANRQHGHLHVHLEGVLEASCQYGPLDGAHRGADRVLHAPGVPVRHPLPPLHFRFLPCVVQALVNHASHAIGFRQVEEGASMIGFQPDQDFVLRLLHQRSVVNADAVVDVLGAPRDGGAHREPPVREGEKPHHEHDLGQAQEIGGETQERLLHDLAPNPVDDLVAWARMRLHQHGCERSDVGSVHDAHRRHS
mmetsp:Transcript_159286/g.511057  ORF Transcript_159286/g.511057 Transcript_159286/m.511057 type:complete len:207 (+) Transcript_159286:646-1266(+)